jgi:hypothetical protein
MSSYSQILLAAAAALALHSHAIQGHYALGARNAMLAGTNADAAFFARGFNGYIPVQPIFRGGGVGSGGSITADSTTLYVLEGQSASSTGPYSGLRAYPLGGLPNSRSNPPALITLTTALDDLVSLNGSLFGLARSGTTLTLSQVSTTGTVTPRLTIDNVATTNFSLSADVTRNTLHILGGVPRTSSPTATYYAVDASTLTVTSSSTIALPSYASGVFDLVTGTSGDVITAKLSALPVSFDYALPDFTPTTGFSNRPSSLFATATEVSDAVEFRYTGMPAAHLTASFNVGANFQFIRKPTTVTGSVEVELYNGAGPDDATITDVRAQNLISITGIFPATINNNSTQPGRFERRELGTASFAINLGGTTSGIAAITATGNLLATRTNTDGTTSTTGFRYYRQGQAFIAYEAPSSNLIGNGDFELNVNSQAFGWMGNSAFLSTAGANEFMRVLALSFGGPQVLTQKLTDLPAGQLVELAFDARFEPAFSGFSLAGTLDVFLGEHSIYSLAFNKPLSQFTRFDQQLTLPSDLPADSELRLEFRRAPSGFVGFIADIDNISLVAIPEPTALASLPLAAVAMRRRR